MAVIEDAEDTEARRLVRGLVDALPAVRGALLGSVDGRPLASVLADQDPDATAAIVAASLGLGARLADLTGEERLQEIVVRSGSGYVVIYAVGDGGVLTLLVDAGANLALVHLRARAVAAELVEAVARR